MDTYKIVYSLNDTGIWETFFETRDVRLFDLVWDDTQVYIKKYIELIQSKEEIPLIVITDDVLVYELGNAFTEVSMIPLWFRLYGKKDAHPTSIKVVEQRPIKENGFCKIPLRRLSFY